MDNTEKLIPNPVAVLREEFDDWAILFNPDTAEAVGLNPVGVAVWKLIDGKRSIVEISASVAEQYDQTPPTLIDEVRKYVEDLSAHGFLGHELETPRP
jgi:SynChlorMet cassette protein ScmD